MCGRKCAQKRNTEVLEKLKAQPEKSCKLRKRNVVVVVVVVVVLVGVVVAAVVVDVVVVVVVVLVVVAVGRRPDPSNENTSNSVWRRFRS